MEETKQCDACLGAGIRTAGTNIETGRAYEQQCWKCAGRGVVRLDDTAILVNTDLTKEGNNAV